MELHKWDRSRLVYLYEHDQFTVSEVAKFIQKTLDVQKKELLEKVKVEMEKMYPEFQERGCNDLLVQLNSKILYEN